jgi:streptogramin lyase
LAALCVATPWTLAEGAVLSGSLLAEGQPIAGAMVTATDSSGNRKETVYTDASGRYKLPLSFAGKVSVRARVLYYRDALQVVDLATDATRTLNFSLSRLHLAADLSESLPASAHLSALSWDNRESRAAFVSQCNYCHQIGNTLTRAPRETDAWRTIVRRMEGYLAMLDRREVEDISRTLARGFDGKPVAAIERILFHPGLTHAKVKEWVVGDGMSFIHDVEVGGDEQLYGADQGHDVIWRLDRQTGRIDRIPLPDIDLPEGGVFSAMQLPIGIYTGKHGPHSLAQGKDGRFWITNSLSSTLASFNPATGEFRLYDVGRTHLYPHTVRIDREGMVWFTIAASNEVGRFDPTTEKFTVIPLPHDGFWRAVSDYAFPYVLKIASWFPKMNLPLMVSHHKWTGIGRNAFNVPYGIDVNPVDGSIWYAKLNSSKIGRIDPHSLQIIEYDTPLRGPRRMRFDAEGVLWIPAFDEGGLMRFDPRSGRFETFRLPLLAPNEYEVPYALNIHPKTGDVWITSNMSDRIFRFIPASGEFISYPLPTRVTWLRDLTFARDGGICSASSNLPAYAIEGGFASFLCLYPNGTASAAH